MVVVAQLARAPACGAGGCRIIPGRPPTMKNYSQGNKEHPNRKELL